MQGCNVSSEYNDAKGLRVAIQVDHSVVELSHMDRIWKTMKDYFQNVKFIVEGKPQRPDTPLENFSFVTVCEDRDLTPNLKACFWVLPQNMRSIVICANITRDMKKPSAELVFVVINHNNVQEDKQIPLDKYLYDFIKDDARLKNLSMYMEARQGKVQKFGTPNSNGVQQRAICCTNCGKQIPSC